MESRTADRFVRILPLAPIVILAFAGCTCSGSPSGQPPPTATATTRRAGTPTPVARAADVLPSPVATVATPPALEESPTPDVAAAERRTVCEGYVAVLSGRKADPALLDNAEVRTLGMQSPDLVTCGAVLSDSDVLCNRFLPMGHGPGSMCSYMRSIFSELRQYPTSHAFLLSDYDLKELAQVKIVAPALWNAVQKALRSGDPKECAAAGDLDSICRAYIGLDKSLCSLPGKLGDVDFEPPKGEGKVKLRDLAKESCEQQIDSRAFLAQGLNALAESGPPRERELAKAALRQADACEKYAQAAVQFCVGSGATPVPRTAVSGSPAPTPPGPGAPAGPAAGQHAPG